MSSISSISSIICNNSLFEIKGFLSNNDIIQLLLTSKKIRNMIGNKNIFTSITINIHSNICDMIRYYLKNKISIIKTVLIDIKNPYDIWPFSSNKMVFVNCDVNEKNVKDNYDCGKIIIFNKNITI